MSRAVGPPLLQPACPRCAAALADEQAWCLECGTAARTRIAPTPRRWRLVAVALSIASLLAIVAIAVAVARLVRADSSASVTPPATSAQPGVAPGAGTPSAPAPSGTVSAQPSAPAVAPPAAGTPTPTQPPPPAAAQAARPANRPRGP